MKNTINFIYIGPDKSGSTWLYEIFKQHPQIFIPDAKDIYFFDRYYYKGFDWYLSFFKGSEGYKAVGEISHDYLFSQKAAQRIYEFFGKKIKLLTILRNPIEKTWSTYLFVQRSGLTSKSFMEAIKDYPEIIDRSLYGKHLKSYFKIFDKVQIKIFLFDDLEKSPRDFAKNIFKVLNVDFIETLPYEKKVLPASKPRSYFLAKLAKKSANLLRNLGMVNLLGKIKTNELILKLLYKPYEKKPSMPPEIKEFLIENYFKKDIELLSQITNKDFSFWLKEKKQTK